MKHKIAIEQHIEQNIDLVWMFYTSPEHIIHWNHASDDWHTTKAENDLRIGGRFSSRMEAKDGSFGFDFEGTYVAVDPFERIDYILDDNRIVSIRFHAYASTTKIEIIFEAEEENSYELQEQGWQAILDQFKRYVESQPSKNS
jgi:uncharacterized protein YndB with AHSA1/START domain